MTNQTNVKIVRWGAVVPIVLIGAIVLLMGLPLAAVWIVSNSSCCISDGMVNVTTFWASLTAGFLALFGLVITGVFVITSFRTDATARAEASNAVATYIQLNKETFFEELRKFQKELADGTEQVKTCAKEVKEKTKVASEQIERDRKTVEDLANDAKQSIGKALNGVEEQRVEAMGEIEAARRAVEEAAATARDRIDQATRSLPPPPPEDGPDQ